MSQRVHRLLSRLHSEVASSGSHKIISPTEQELYKRIAQEVFTASKGSEAETKAEFLMAFAERMTVEIREDELIIGSQRFMAGTGHGNMGHIVVDYGRVIEQGVDGMLALAERMPEGRNKEPFRKALKAFSTFIARHAEACGTAHAELAKICGRIAHKKPESFHEALQLLWFIQIFLHAEGVSAAISFGRFDQYMLKLYNSDIRSGKLVKAKAKELLEAFFIKTCEGEESQNLTLGGIDENGANAENGLSILCLEAITELGVWQPSISVRLHEGSLKEFREAAAALAMKGIGQPSFFNDPTVIASLEAAGVGEKRAKDYGIVGCYEAMPQGDACPMTVAGTLNLPAILVGFLNNTTSCDSFDALLKSFKLHLKDRYENERMPEYRRRLEDLSRNAASPFESVCVKGCIESGLCAEEGGAATSLFGVNIMGIGTLVDSFAALKKMVFEEGGMPLADFTAEVKANFPDAGIHALCKGLPEKFGRDETLTNGLAKELSEFIAEMVLSSRLGAFRPYPGLFWFGGDIAQKVPATPDGRRNDERLSYGCGPSEVEGLEATATLKSASHLANRRFACGNPLKLSFQKGDLSKARLLALLD